MWSWKFLQVTHCVPPVICLAARTLDMMEHCQLVPARHKQKQSAPRDLRLRLPHHARHATPGAGEGDGVGVGVFVVVVIVE